MRYVAHITIKTLTPLKVGSSKIALHTDMPVNRDFNNLPFIQGTTIAGILRKEFEEKEAENIFGYEKSKKDGQGSKVIISNALLLDENGKVHEGLLNEKSEFLSIFDNLPVREHTAINAKGTAKEHSKYDEEIVYKGAMFKFSIESENKEYIQKILSKLEKIRVGGKTTNGYGKFEVVNIEYEEMDEKRYENYTASLNEKLNSIEVEFEETDYIVYELTLKPDDTFFIFGSGKPDDDVDMTYVKEKVLDYKNKTLNEMALIPGSSIKGALSHRVAYYYNLQEENFDLVEYDKDTNPAVIELFGSKKDEKSGQKGNVIVEDVYFEAEEEKKFDHVKIDRFTGGAFDGALFNEKTTTVNEIKINIYVKKSTGYIELLEKAIKDICEGMLPLGGMVTKGHGMFVGSYEKRGENE